MKYFYYIIKDFFVPLINTHEKNLHFMALYLYQGHLKGNVDFVQLTPFY